MITSGEDNVPGNQFIIYDGKLGELDASHSGHSCVAPFPVELDVVRGVAICSWGTHKK